MLVEDVGKGGEGAGPDRRAGVAHRFRQPEEERPPELGGVETGGQDGDRVGVRIGDSTSAVQG